MTSAKDAVEQAWAAVAEATRALNDERARRRILCSCKKYHAINKLELLVTHWYVEPCGCSGGDYWREGEWQFVCPSTGMRNRLLFDDYGVDWGERNRTASAAVPAFKQLYRGLFASRRDVYESDGADYPWVNNYYVDKHRARFELPEKPTRKP